MIDFQISRNTNPAFDLAYGLTTCTNGEKRIENLEKWQRIWYDRFSHDMEVLGFDAQRLYPFDDFLVDYSNFYGMGFAFSMQAYQVNYFSALSSSLLTCIFPAAVKEG